MSTYLSPGKIENIDISQLDVPPFVKEYLNYTLAIKNLTANTINTYYVQIRDFLRWTQCRHDVGVSPAAFREIVVQSLPFSAVEGITRSDILEYLSFCATTLNNSASSRGTKISVLNGFFSYFADYMKKLPENPMSGIEMPKKPKTLPKYLSLEQSLHMLNTVKETPVSKFPSRDYCMLTFFLNCGMRRSELIKINCKDIVDDRLILRGKGRKERVIYLNGSCLAALQEYLPERNAIISPKIEPALFISQNTRRRITDRRVHQIIEKMLLVSGLSGMGFSPHKLRHTAATLMYQNGGVDVLTLKEVLGHESIATTQIYTHLNPESVKDAVNRSPLADVGVPQDVNDEKMTEN